MVKNHNMAIYHNKGSEAQAVLGGGTPVNCRHMCGLIQRSTSTSPSSLRELFRRPPARDLFECAQRPPVPLCTHLGVLRQHREVSIPWPDRGGQGRSLGPERGDQAWSKRPRT